MVELWRHLCQSTGKEEVNYQGEVCEHCGIASLTQGGALATAPRQTRRSGLFLAVAAVIALALSPAVVDARAGQGNSSGSRGNRTHSAPPSTNTAPAGAQQMQRTATPATAAAAAPAPARGGFMSGIAGGLLMGGLFGLMLGGSMFGAGLAGLLGVLLQVALIGGLIYLAMRLFRRSRLATPSGPAMFTGDAQAMAAPDFTPRHGGGSAPAGPPVHITPADFSAFEQNLKAVQAAYSTQSLPEMQRLATLEMLTYFESEFAQQYSHGVRNMISDVKLLQGDLAEAWSEQGREYATVAMRFGLIDITRDATGRVVDGNPTQPTEAKELWTFVRAPGAEWMLSAIQQAR